VSYPEVIDAIRKKCRELGLELHPKTYTLRIWEDGGREWFPDDIQTGLWHDVALDVADAVPFGNSWSIREGGSLAGKLLREGNGETNPKTISKIAFETVRIYQREFPDQEPNWSYHWWVQTLAIEKSANKLGDDVSFDVFMAACRAAWERAEPIPLSTAACSGQGS
jgi:hypothetical protein